MIPCKQTLKTAKDCDACEVTFAEARLWLTASGALLWPEESLLVFSDLHFEKGSYLAHHGSALPAYDTHDTLDTMAKAIAQFEPDEVLCLGDSFHDKFAHQRMNRHDSQKLEQLTQSISQWHWILGNHDPELPKSYNGLQHTHYQRKAITFCHEAEPDLQHQIVGHYHPKTRIKRSGITLSGRCFIHDESLMILPSFGSYTGGLDVKDKAISTLFKAKRHHTYLIYNSRIKKVS